jgi:acyl-CoA reductase-like NAD-dependent aldehyde dehydrogenase
MTKQLPTNVLPEVAAFLAQDPLPAMIGGQQVLASNDETFCTLDPGSGMPLAEVAAMQPDDVDRAVKAAQHAFDTTGWPQLSPNERGVLLHRFADAIEKRKPIIAQIEALDCGKILAQAEGDVQNCVDTLRYYTDLAIHVGGKGDSPHLCVAPVGPFRRAPTGGWSGTVPFSAQCSSPLAIAGHEARTVRLPWGPCGFIFPWNFPILLVGWNISPALAAGNTVVIKPAEDTPLSAIYLARLAREVGIPDGVINVVPGLGQTAGAALSAHPGLKRMSFTGSPEVGRLIAAACGQNLVPVKLELGGKGAAVVFDDVDLPRTVEALAGAITFHTGQVCCDATRWLVHQSIYKKFVAASVERLGRVKVGYQFDPDSQMGPVVSEKQRKRVLGYLEHGRQEGAELVLEGGPAQVAGRDGFYVKPALLAGSLGNVAAREEIFGPVAFLTSFGSEDEAVDLVNATDYGLANSVWTSDLARANRVAEAMVAGNSWINAHNVFPHGVPYAGVNRSGLGGGVLSVETLFDYWRSLSVVRPL